MVPILIIFLLLTGCSGLAWFCYRAYQIRKIYVQEVEVPGRWGLLRFIQQHFFRLWLILWFSLGSFILSLLLSWGQTYQQAHKSIPKNTAILYATKYWQPWIDYLKQHGVRAIYSLEKDTLYGRPEGILRIQLFETGQDWPSSTMPFIEIFFCENACASKNINLEKTLLLNHEHWQLRIPKVLMNTHSNEVMTTRIVFMLYPFEF